VFYNAKSFKGVSASTVIFDGDKRGGNVRDRGRRAEDPAAHGAIRRLRPDGTFGDMQLSTPLPRSGKVVAVTDTKPPVINRRAYLFLVYHPARGQT
jgi:hypothetical protein